MNNPWLAAPHSGMTPFNPIKPLDQLGDVRILPEDVALATRFVNKTAGSDAAEILRMLGI